MSALKKHNISSCLQDQEHTREESGVGNLSGTQIWVDSSIRFVWVGSAPKGPQQRKWKSLIQYCKLLCIFGPSRKPGAKFPSLLDCSSSSIHTTRISLYHTASDTQSGLLGHAQTLLITLLQACKESQTLPRNQIEDYTISLWQRFSHSQAWTELTSQCVEFQPGIISLWQDCATFGPAAGGLAFCQYI